MITLFDDTKWECAQMVRTPNLSSCLMTASAARSSLLKRTRCDSNELLNELLSPSSIANSLASSSEPSSWPSSLHQPDGSRSDCRRPEGKNPARLKGSTQFSRSIVLRGGAAKKSMLVLVRRGRWGRCSVGRAPTFGVDWDRWMAWDPVWRLVGYI